MALSSGRVEETTETLSSPLRSMLNMEVPGACLRTYFPTHCFSSSYRRHATGSQALGTVVAF